MNYALGIDLGGSSIKTAAVTTEGGILGHEHAIFREDTEKDWAAAIRSLVAQTEIKQRGPAEVIGLSAPGLAARNGRSIAHMPGRLQGLEKLDWTNFLGRTRTVPVLNDAHAALLGEGWLGAARGFTNVIMLTLGTGVGGAAMVDGRLLRGHIGRAGHLGHTCLDSEGDPDVCGTPGSLEVALGNWTISERTGGRFSSTHELVAAHVAGDAAATAIWLESVWKLACAITSFVNILDPQAVIIGGGIAKSGEALFEPLRKFMPEIEWRPGGHQVELLPATLGEFAGAIGAARHALEGESRIPVANI